VNTEIQAHFAEVKHQIREGLNPRINPDKLQHKPPKNFELVIAAINSQAWAAEFNS
jgi:hypothetical protein